MQQRREVVRNTRGDPIEGVHVLVKTVPGGATATLFSDYAGTPLANPVKTDKNGVYAYYTADGRYSETVYGEPLLASYTISDILLEDVSDGRLLTQGNRAASVTLKSQWSDSRYTVPVGLDKAIVVLGDSISHGAFQGNLYQDGWVNVLKRMLNAETGGRGYGFAPLLNLGSGATLSKEVHDVNFTGTWVGTESTTGGEDILQGLAFTSSTAGDNIQISVPTFQRMVRLWYVAKPGGGIFSYSVNGGTATNVDTSAATRDVSASVLVAMTDAGAGAFGIQLTVVSGSVTLCGIGYETPPNEGDGKAGNVVQNFSQSGRRLHPATEGMIDLACRGSVLVLALGYNDYGDCAALPTYNTEFQQRIDWIIQYCLRYNTTLVVADFCWWAAPSNPCRAGLKRAAISTDGIYIPLPDYLTHNQAVKTDFATDTSYMVDTLKKWIDGAHPNPSGAKWIAETVAKAMGLACTSKEQALARHDYPFPLQFDPASIFKNALTQMPYLSYLQRVGGNIVFNIRTTTKSNAAIPVGANYVLNKPTNSATSVRQYTITNVSGIDPCQPIGMTSAGAVTTALGANPSGDLLITCFATYLKTISYGFVLPMETTATKA